MPRPSPKMDIIFKALLQGWPNTAINELQVRQYIVWGLIASNSYILKNEKAYFCDMPYFDRWLPDQPLENSKWRLIPGNVHNNKKLDVTIDRFESFNKKVSPWQQDGEHILICPSSNTMTMHMHNMSDIEWVAAMKKTLGSSTKRPIKVRNKPRKNGTSGPSVADVSIEDDLKGCHAVVTSGSLVAVDALMAGVPVFTSSQKYCPAAWTANTDLEKINNPVHYDREQLLANLAWKQFSIEEMRSGFAYESIKRLYLNK